jgi:hypothetical protein
MENIDIKTQRNKNKLHHQGYLYRFHKLNADGDIKFWQNLLLENSHHQRRRHCGRSTIEFMESFMVIIQSMLMPLNKMTIIILLNRILTQNQLFAFLLVFPNFIK